LAKVVAFESWQLLTFSKGGERKISYGGLLLWELGGLPVTQDSPMNRVLFMHLATGTPAGAFLKKLLQRNYRAGTQDVLAEEWS
jgi:hypothetical protein